LFDKVIKALFIVFTLVGAYVGAFVGAVVVLVLASIGLRFPLRITIISEPVADCVLIFTFEIAAWAYDGSVAPLQENVTTSPAGILTLESKSTVNVFALKTAVFIVDVGVMKLQTGTTGQVNPFNCTVILPAEGIPWINVKVTVTTTLLEPAIFGDVVTKALLGNGLLIGGVIRLLNMVGFVVPSLNSPFAEAACILPGFCNPVQTNPILPSIDAAGIETISISGNVALL